jgi:hypothetical protein
MEAYDIMERIEKHVGKKVDNQRLRDQLILALQDEIDAHNDLKGHISDVLEGFKTYNPKYKKSIYLSARERREK